MLPRLDELIGRAGRLPLGWPKRHSLRVPEAMPVEVEAVPLELTSDGATSAVASTHRPSASSTSGCAADAAASCGVGR